MRPCRVEGLNEVGLFKTRWWPNILANTRWRFGLIETRRQDPPDTDSDVVKIWREFKAKMDHKPRTGTVNCLPSLYNINLNCSRFNLVGIFINCMQSCIFWPRFRVFFLDAVTGQQPNQARVYRRRKNLRRISILILK